MIRNILLGSGSNLLVLFVKMALTFIMAPILVKSLGNYDYGLWEMIGAVIGYMGMLDLGIRPAITRYTAQYNASGERQQQEILFSTSFVFLLFIGFLLATAFAIWGLVFPHSLAQEGSSTERYTLLCLILAAQFLIIMPGYVAEGVLEGLQKYHIKNLVTLVNSLLGSAILFAYITPENGLVLLAGVNALGLSIKYILYFVILAGPTGDRLKLHLTIFSFNKLREIMIFGSKSLVQGISHRIESATDTLVIGWFMGPAMVPFYSIPANLVGYIRSIGWNIAHVFMPLFSQLATEGKQAEIVKMYLVASKYMVGTMLLIATGVILLGADFVSIWMGPEYGAEASLLIAILVGYVIIPLLNPFASRYLTAIDKHGIYAKYGPVCAVVNLLLSIALVGPMGIIGVALGSLIPISLFAIIYLRCCCLHLGISVFDYVRASVLPCALPAIAMAASIYCFKQLWATDSYIVLIATAILASFIFLLLFWLLSLNKDERFFLLSKIKLNR